MKKVLLIMVLLHNVYALDTLSAMPKDQKSVINRIVKVLKLPNNHKNQKIIYDKLGVFFTKNWSAHWTTNKTGAHSKIKNSAVQICDVTIYNNNRIVNGTFVYFKKEKQLFITLKQYIEAKSSSVLKKYKERKNDSKYTLERETDHYAYFQEKGYMSYETYHVKSPSGMVIYESSYFFDIK
ncbi:hypothetical protein [Sulfurospirillum sp. 1612]|uniref:hypothetical protein n=1 Tax=Sulfurospirillum sp. 1612 TaxID=3094835 RepID=UPI002F921C7D